MGVSGNTNTNLAWIHPTTTIAMASKTAFNAISPVPTATDFLDIVLSKTQRKTPTVSHPAKTIERG